MSLDIFKKKFQKKFEILIIGHRGASNEACENTLQAFELAVDGGAEMIELDVHKTIDNHIMVIHDRFTGRVSRMNIDIHRSTLEEAQKVPMRGGLQIPTLDEVLMSFKGKVYFNIEIKQRGIESEIYTLIDRYNLRDQCVISSFLFRLPRLNIKTNNEVLTASIGIDHIKIVKRTLKLGLDGVHPQFLIVTPKLVSKAHSNNLFVNAWTANNPKSWNRLIKCGVDGIMTNNPRKLHKFLKSR